MRRLIWLCLWLLIGLSSAGSLLAQESVKPDVRFGLVLVPPHSPWLERAVAAGAGSNRYQLNWWDVEPEPGWFNWSVPDQEIASMRAAGMEVTVLLHAPPAWAREPGYQWVPRNLDLPWDAPENVWGRFAFEVARRYRGQVRFYEIFNEPDLRQYWDGSPAQYARLLAVAYQAIKAADPDAQVVMAGMAHWINPQFAEQVLQALHDMPAAAEHAFYFDVAAWHWYSRVDLLYERVRWARDLLARYGMGNKPIWINETNLPVWGDGPGPQQPTQGFGTPDEQAAFIVQAFANAFAAGAERVFVFRLNDGFMDQTFGLMHNDGAPRPAYLAYRTTARWLGRARFVTRQVYPNGVVTVFRRPTGERVSVVWNTTESWITFELSALADEGLLVTPDGSTVRLVAEGGVYRFDLPPGRRETLPDGQDVLVVGGMPVFIVEQDMTPPQVEMVPLPLLSADENVTLRWHTVTPSGAPVDRYEVEIRVDDGEWQPWVTVKEPTVTLAGEMGHRYAFRVRAVDINGLRSPWPPDDQPMAETIIGGAVTGRLVNLFDEPLVHERVCVGQQWCTFTDGAGFFRLEGLPPGRYAVSVLGWDVRTTVTVRAGEETLLAAVRPRLPAGLLRNSEFDGLRGWIPLPPEGVQIARGPAPFARLTAGAQVAQVVEFPNTGQVALWLRYRTNGAGLEVRLIGLGKNHQDRRLFLDRDTLGEWREVAFDMSAWAGQRVVLVVRAEGLGGTLDLDTVWAGEPPQRQGIYLPLIMSGPP